MTFLFVSTLFKLDDGIEDRKKSQFRADEPITHSSHSESTVKQNGLGTKHMTSFQQ